MKYLLFILFRCQLHVLNSLSQESQESHPYPPSQESHPCPPSQESHPCPPSQESHPCPPSQESHPALRPKRATPVLRPKRATPALRPKRATPALRPLLVHFQSLHDLISKCFHSIFIIITLINIIFFSQFIFVFFVVCLQLLTISICGFFYVLSLSMCCIVYSLLLNAIGVCINNAC